MVYTLCILLKYIYGDIYMTKIKKNIYIYPGLAVMMVNQYFWLFKEFIIQARLLFLDFSFVFVLIAL